MLNHHKFQQMKQENQRISMITAYDYPSAKLSEQAGIDMILVGDSLGMVVLGYDSTVNVTLEDMIHHGKAVARGAKNTFKVVDMPFMSYHISLEDSLANAKRLFQETGAQALKVEGASEEIAMLTSKLTSAGIPVVAHLGLTPQSVNVLGGYRVQGKDKNGADKIINDAKMLQGHGAIALVLECVPASLAKTVTESLDIPTIGIGAGIDCDGQVLVYHDVLQYGVERLPKFVKAFENANERFLEAIQAYISEVQHRDFPGEEHSFLINR
ncbi:3-methyl-2-oxobutanoate hydroxymethyltransferase [Radiobacillus sp. PE A8.2]|uniref:3-methyl-2-oxobutanoate hydroxymethyltransferase n=1 Tax=Radiobacillus sp. PE A8.2 TaxID=3380349 RepID=UPI0038903154